MKILSKYALCLVFGCLSLTACSSNQTDFKHMNSAELVAYNRTVDFWEQVHCVDEVRTGSHIRRRHCNTLYEIYTQVDRSASAVNVMSASLVY